MNFPVCEPSLCVHFNRLGEAFELNCMNYMAAAYNRKLKYSNRNVKNNVLNLWNHYYSNEYVDISFNSNQ